MIFVLLSAQISLSFIFFISAGFKLFDFVGFRQALADFSIPKWAIRFLTLAIPIVELCVAGGLLFSFSTWFAALAGLTLLLAFMIAISVNLAQGRRPNCHCFGKLYSKPIGWPILGRNFLLAIVSGILLWKGKNYPILSPFTWIKASTMNQTLALVLIVTSSLLLGVITWLLFRVLAQQKSLLLRFDAIESKFNIQDSLSKSESISEDESRTIGLDIGQKAPEFQLKNLEGEQVNLSSFIGKGKSVFLAFIHPNCGPCNSLLPKIGQWQEEMKEKAVFLVISQGKVESNIKKAVENHLTNVLLQNDREVAIVYNINSTPSMVIVQSSGRIGSQTVLGTEMIVQMVEQFATRSLARLSHSVPVAQIS